MEKEENLNQDDNTKQSTEDNSNTEKLLKEFIENFLKKTKIGKRKKLKQDLFALYQFVF